MISIVLGTKAQLVKMAPVMKCLQERGMPYRFIHTGQHKETMYEMYHDFGIKCPDITLYSGPDIVSVRQIITWFIRLLIKLYTQRKQIFGKTKEGIVLVHGDTLSTLLGALSGRAAGLKVGHIESGLRSFNYFHPFPEEITRVLVFRLSHILYCPGQWAVDNVSRLKKEIVNTRFNTLYDTIDLSRNRMKRSDHIPKYPFGIVSLHRYENIFDKEQLLLIVNLLKKIAANARLLFVLHPSTAKQLHKYELFEDIQSHSNIECVPRFHHSDFLILLRAAEFVVTDGGSLQEETSYMGKPCLLLREATERMEGLGENVVLSKYKEDLVEEFVSNYRKYQRSIVNNRFSPSGFIVETIQKYCDPDAFTNN